MSFGMTCPKCGLMQLAGPRCKSCGAPLGDPAREHAPAPSSPVIPPPPESPATQTRPASGAETPGQSRRPSFHGTGWSLFGIHIVNTFLTIITLGIYYFWGKVKVRSYLLSQSEFEGDRFAYHGTGKELLIGFLKALVAFGIPLVLLGILRDMMIGMPVIRAVLALLTYLIILTLIPFATVGARRYRLSRTSWRQIRFSFRGHAVDFIKLFVWGSLLTTVTLGIYYPFFDTRRQGFLVSHSYFGNQRFDFDGSGRDLFRGFLLAILLFFPTLGLSWVWYLAKKQRYFWQHTTFATARFHSTVTGGRLFLLMAGNLLLVLVTFGLGWPWVMVRNVRFALRYVTVEGPLDLATIQQEAQSASATGEALAGFLDAGLDLG